MSIIFLIVVVELKVMVLICFDGKGFGICCFGDGSGIFSPTNLLFTTCTYQLIACVFCMLESISGGLFCASCLVGNSYGVSVREYFVGVGGDIRYSCNDSDIEKFDTSRQADDNNGQAYVNVCLYLFLT